MGGEKTANVELDLGRYELRRAGRRVKIEKKPMELLIFLVRQRGQLVPREEIVAKLWHSDLFVDTERNVNSIVRKIRRALNDDAEKPRFLETVVGKGYRFVGTIRVIGPQGMADSTGSGGAAAVAVGGEWKAERASLAVVPLRAVGEFVDDKGLCLGFADALLARLANLEDVDVLPTATVLTVPIEARAGEIGARLGVRFVVHGGIQAAKEESRLLVELFDCHAQSSCFTRRFNFDVERPFERVNEIATQTARALRRPIREPAAPSGARDSRDRLAYAEFIEGFRRSSSGEPQQLEEATRHLMNAVARDPEFALAHAILSYVCATRHYELDPSRSWLEKAEFHCQRALELDAALPEGHVAKAFLLWGPSKNFQHLEAIAELKRALGLQKNLPHAYNRLGTILAHIGLLDHARAMYERGKPFSPKKTLSHSVAQVYFWGGEHGLLREEIESWRAEAPTNKYAIYFASELALATKDFAETERLLEEAAGLMAEEPLIESLRGVVHALAARKERALECMNRACANPKSFGHAHHTYYQIARILSLLGRPEAAFEWLERSVDTGFACWPFFRRDSCLRGLGGHGQFELLVSSLQARYPEHLGLL